MEFEFVYFVATDKHFSPPAHVTGISRVEKLNELKYK